MSILFAALDQAARSHRAAHGTADTTFPPVFSQRRRNAHMPWWLALVGGIGIGLSSLNFMAPPAPQNNLPARIIAPSHTNEQAATQPAPVSHASQDQETVVPVSQVTPAIQPDPVDTSDQISYNAPGLSIRTERSPPPLQQILSRAQAAARAGDFSAAIVGYNTVLERVPENREALSGKAFALQQSGATTDAAVIWARLYQSDPNDQVALANMATAATSGTQSMPEQTAPSPATPPQASTLYAAAAHTRIKQGDLDGAQNDLERAWALDRNNPITRLNLAIIADRRGDAATALNLYRQVLADPVAAETLLPMSWTAIEARADYLAQRNRP